MNIQTKHTNTLNDLAQFGTGMLAYIKQISDDDARALIGDLSELPANTRFFCLFAADGTPLSISDSPEVAFENAIEHDLHPIALH